MSNINDFIQTMKSAKVSEQTIQIFKYYFQLLIAGEKGKLSKDQITTPKPNHIIDFNELNDLSHQNLKKLAVIKLNGGLGTSMGLSQAKSLLPVKDGYTFLDIIAKQTLILRKQYHINLPIMFMNSFYTSQDTVNFLKKYPELKNDNLPIDFLQNKFPKVRKDDYKPLSDQNEENNWNPPGHGDLYNVLSNSSLSASLLDTMIDNGIEYIFVSNSDNLGAVIDPKILNRLIKDDIDFAMEVCIRTEMDKKGGHLAATNEGKLILREVAQCPEDEVADFQNIQTYKYFNTNNLWIKLTGLKKKIQTYGGFLPLNLILNQKNVNDVPVYQLETAMGAAISLFDNSKALCVPRSRFLPVKKNQDLLLLWSDNYELDENFVLMQKAGAKDTILDLDDNFFGKIDLLKNACQKGIPSLFNCDYLKIKGNVRFGSNVKFVGKVNVETDKEMFLENVTIDNRSYQGN